MKKYLKLSYIPPKVTLVSFKVEDAMVSLTANSSGAGYGTDTWLEASSSSSPDGSNNGNNAFGTMVWDE